MPNLGQVSRNYVSGAPVTLTLPNTGEGGSYGNAQYNIYQNRFYGGNEFFHYKTNISYYGWSMFNIEAVGYNYGSNLPIRCNWCGHVSYGNGLYNLALRDIYTGLSANRIYNSSDGYLCIVAQGNSYFSGWSFNAYSLNPTGPLDVTILAATQSSSNSNVY